MNETQKQVPKNPKWQKPVKNSQETYKRRLKEGIVSFLSLVLRISTPSNSSSTGRSMASTSSSTDNSTTISSHICIYGAGRFAVLAIGACVFFPYNNKSSKTWHKEEAKEQQQPIDPQI